jgi:hypothetical protein
MVGEPADEPATVLELVVASLEIGRVDELADQFKVCHNLC